MTIHLTDVLDYKTQKCKFLDFQFNNLVKRIFHDNGVTCEMDPWGHQRLLKIVVFPGFCKNPKRTQLFSHNMCWNVNVPSWRNNSTNDPISIRYLFTLCTLGTLAL